MISEETLPAKDVSRFSAVVAREEFHRELRRLSSSQWHWGDPEEVRVRPLKAHKNRCTFDISVKTHRGWHGVIGKVYSDDRSDVFNASQAIVRSGFRSDLLFGTPQPLAYLPGLNVLFEEKVEGKCAMEIFLSDELEQQLVTAERCGAWLARFHTIAPRPGSNHQSSDLRSLVVYWIERVKNYGEQFAEKAELLSQKLDSAWPPVDSIEQCAGHGSYIPEHVFVNGKRTVAIDLDEHDVADPGRDLAWFSVSLQRLGLKQTGQLHAHDSAVGAFLQAYAAARPVSSSTICRFSERWRVYIGRTGTCSSVTSQFQVGQILCWTKGCAFSREVCRFNVFSMRTFEARASGWFASKPQPLSH